MRDVLERGARAGRERLEEARSGRRRDQALVDFAELVIELIDRGEAPELRADDRSAPGDRDRRMPARTGMVPASDRRPPARTGEPGDLDGDTVSSRAWRPPPASGDGGVWRPPVDRDPASEPGARFAEKGEKAAKSDDDKPAPTAKPSPERPDRPTMGDNPTRPLRAARAMPAMTKARGGIQFDENDEDLAEYMNPDDVPAATEPADTKPDKKPDKA
jgi:hypothetical protein